MSLDTQSYNNIYNNPKLHERRNKALLEAAERGYEQRLRAMLQAGADVDYTDPGGRTALWLAADAGFVDGVRILINAGSDINVRGGSGEVTPLHRAASKDSIDVVRVLLSTPGIEKNATSYIGFTALHFAALEGRTEVIKELIRHGVSIDARSRIKATALHVAAHQTDCLPAVKALVELGADIHAKGHLGKTPLDMARTRCRNSNGSGTSEIVEYLKAAEDLERRRKKV